MIDSLISYQSAMQKTNSATSYASLEGYLAGKVVYSVFLQAYVNSMSFLDAIAAPFGISFYIGQSSFTVGSYLI